MPLKNSFPCLTILRYLPVHMPEHNVPIALPPAIDAVPWSEANLVKQTEAHVIVRLLLLLFLLLSLGLLSGSSATGSGATSSSSSTSSATRWDRRKLGRALSDQLKYGVSRRIFMVHKSTKATSLMSLPSSSERSFSRRSSSASMPTDSRTPLMSFALGLVLPPRPRRRYAARL